MKKKLFTLLILFVALFLFGCKNREDSDKQLIGFTIYEKTNTIGVEQIFNNLNDIEINGVYASDDYSFVSVKDNSFFEVKTDLSRLQGDLITPDSICLFITCNYYQSQNVNYKLFLYEIYALSDGRYSVEYKDDIQLSSEIGDSILISHSNEAIKDELNYVFSYKISVSKIPTPHGVIVKEFDAENKVISETEISSETTNYMVSKDAAYVIVEEKNSIIGENDQVEEKTLYTLLTDSSAKKSYSFKVLNENNRIINFELRFKFPGDEK